jgi:CDP-diacylglycerol--glycerol-3-phosphate 3-phosphatidyltransferase
MTLEQLRSKISARITSPLVRQLSKTGITPNVITIIGLALNILAAYFILSGSFFIGGIVILISGLCDILDGALARLTNRGSTFGAILDSTVDRISEAIILSSLLIRYASHGDMLQIILILAILVGSFLTSYIRAKSEGLGLKCKVGWFTRAERVIVIAVGLLINQIPIILWVLVVFVYITVAQRLIHVRQQNESRNREWQS